MNGKKKTVKFVEKFVNYCCFFELVGCSIIPSGGGVHCFGVNNTEWKYLVNMCNPAS